MSFPPFLRKQNANIFLTIKLHPRSPKNSFKINDYSFDIFIKEPPVKGKANQALVKYLSKLLSIPTSSLTIVGGLKSKTKIVSIIGYSADMILKKIESIKL
ncbi:MAG: DUF167 domain-containing protein [Candidatus Thorarchaeota archaeon]